MTTDIKPPIAAARPHPLRSRFGERQDPYYWLRDDDRADPEVLRYLRAENDYHGRRFAPIKPLEDEIYAEILGRLKQDDSTVPYLKRGFWHYVGFEVGKEYPIFARRRDLPGATVYCVYWRSANKRGFLPTSMPSRLAMR